MSDKSKKCQTSQKKCQTSQKKCQTRQKKCQTFKKSVIQAKSFKGGLHKINSVRALRIEITESISMLQLPDQKVYCL